MSKCVQRMWCAVQHGQWSGAACRERELWSSQVPATDERSFGRCHQWYAQAEDVLRTVPQSLLCLCRRKISSALIVFKVSCIKDASYASIEWTTVFSLSLHKLLLSCRGLLSTFSCPIYCAEYVVNVILQRGMSMCSLVPRCYALCRY